MFIDKIKFNINIVFESTRKDQANKFKVKTKLYQRENRRKPIYDDSSKRSIKIGYETIDCIDETFVIFKKNFEISFLDSITVIVGDNGCGKTSLVKHLIPPKPTEFFSFAGYKTIDEAYEHQIKEWVSNEERTLFFKGKPDMIIVENNIHKHSLVDGFVNSFQGRTLNPHELIHMWDMKTSSNGENTLDFIQSLKGITNSLIVLDEPETSLSIKSQNLVKSIIKELSLNNQLIIITHSENIMRISDQVYDFEKKKYVLTEKYIKQQYS